MMFKRRRKQSEEMPVENSLIAGVLSVDDAESLRRWSEVGAKPSAFIRRELGDAALDVGLYGIALSEEGEPANFIDMNDDMGTVIANRPEIYAQHNLPIGGPAAALKGLTEEERGRGLVRTFNPYYDKKVSIDTPEGIEYGWSVEATSPSGVAYLSRGEEMRQVQVERLNPSHSQLDMPSKHQQMHQKRKLEREREERRQKRMDALFRLPTEEQMRKDPNIARRFSTTEQSINDAVFAYRFVDEDIKELIRGYASETLWREADMPTLIRTNNELRTRLGVRLLEKVNEEGYLYSERVAKDSDKAINSWGYKGVHPDTSSREAAAMIALAMLDGTYKKPTSDPILYNGTRDFRGQHRYVAYKILKTPQMAWGDIVEQKS